MEDQTPLTWRVEVNDTRHLDKHVKTFITTTLQICGALTVKAGPDSIKAVFDYRSAATRAMRIIASSDFVFDDNFTLTASSVDGFLAAALAAAKNPSAINSDMLMTAFIRYQDDTKNKYYD